MRRGKSCSLKKSRSGEWSGAAARLDSLTDTSGRNLESRLAAQGSVAEF